MSGFDEFQVKWDAMKAAVMAAPEFKRFTVKKYKKLRTRDGVAFTCSLYLDGVHEGTIKNDGQGGPTNVFLTSRSCTPFRVLEAIAEAHGVDFETNGAVVDAILTAAGK